MRTLETNQPISTSKLWQLAANYYLNKGPAAWTSEETPSFVTSSCFIAHYYAEIVMHALQDWQTTYSDSSTHSSTPFYILELSSGLGEFAYRFVKELCELLQQNHLTQIKFCYVLTDLVEENVLLWKESAAFANFVEQGWVDFASYDLTKPEPLTLVHSGITLNHEQLTKPLTVIANYIFDSVPCDMFYVTTLGLQQGVITLKVPKEMDIAKPEDLSQITTEINVQNTSGEIYPEPLYNEIIHHYCKLVNGAVVNFPIAALRYLEYLLNLASGNLLLLTSDKGYSTIELIKQIDRFLIDYHNSLSVLVNFHAIEQFFKSNGGDSFYQDQFTQLVTAVYTAGMTLQSMNHLQRFLQIYQQEMSPQEYCRLIYHFSQVREFDVQGMLALFRLSKNDPILLRLMREPILKLSNPYKIHFNHQLRNIFTALQNNIYPPSYHAEFDFTLGSVYHMMGDYEVALEFFDNYTPTPQTEYEYYQRVKDCYHSLQESQKEKKIIPLLRKAKFNYHIKKFKYRLSQFKNRLRHGARFIFILFGILVLIYFVCQVL